MQIELLEGEIWKDIIGYEGHYMVSSHCRVLSVKFKKHVLLSPCKVGRNERYQKVSILKDGNRLRTSIHRLAALAFIPNPNSLTDVNHKDHDRENNHISNLEWTTHRENVNHGALARRGRSTHIGVSFNKQRKKWRAAIYFNNKWKTIGHYLDEELASAAYQLYCTEHGISLKYVA